MYTSNFKDMVSAGVLKNISSETYWFVKDRPVTWLIRMFCPSLGLGVGLNFLSSFDDTNVILDPELTITWARGPSGDPSLTMALEGWAPRNVVLGGLPAAGFNAITSEL